mmetsp:Transcript_23448/g.29890  ORF Transcript_23448/g.29890 Transcript_23448/m.29890 type:complete len:267 (-) Transcript_23448:13-813(-)
MHRTGKMQIIPLEDRSVLISNGDPPELEHPEYTVRPTNSNTATEYFSAEENTVRTFRFSKEKLKELKQEASPPSSSGQFVSTNDAFVALIWQRLSKARCIAPSESVSLGMACNGRSRMNPPLPREYFGNAVFLVFVKVTNQELQAMTLSQVALRIREAVNEITHNKMISAINFVHSISDPGRIIPAFSAQNDFVFTCWNKFPMYSADFGDGNPIHIATNPAKFSGFSLVFDTPLKDGSVDVTIGLKSTVMEKLLEDPQFSHYIITK